MSRWGGILTHQLYFMLCTQQSTSSSRFNNNVNMLPTRNTFKTSHNQALRLVFLLARQYMQVRANYRSGPGEAIARRPNSGAELTHQVTADRAAAELAHQVAADRRRRSRQVTADHAR